MKMIKTQHLLPLLLQANAEGPGRINADLEHSELAKRVPMPNLDVKVINLA